MIVKMKKVTLLVRAADREEAVTRLRTLGVVHVQPVAPPQSEDVARLESELAEVERALSLVGAEAAERAEEVAEPARLVGHILERARQREQLLRELEELRDQHRWFERWGRVSLASVQELARAGIVLRFYVGERQAVRALPPEKTIQVVREEHQTVYFVYFATSSDDRLEFREEPMPEVEVDALEAQMAEAEQAIAAIEQELAALARHRPALGRYQQQLTKRLEFGRVLAGMGQAEEIAFLQGFCPAEEVKRVTAAADREGWAYTVADPDNPEEVPTLIRNPRWLRIVEPVFKFLGTVPGYAEHDISFWFLLFFSVFFAILIGDAGYGVLFLAATWLVRRKARQAPREPFLLMYVLSFATLMWGAISGNWFGVPQVAQLPVLKRLIVDPVNAFATDNQDFMMYFCFLIGALHLTVAHAMNAFRLLNSLRALAQVGWIAIVWGLFFTAGRLVLGKSGPSATVILALVGGGTGLVLLFANAQRKFFKGVLQSLAETPLSVISSFSDVVSYLRLFAVGFASVTVESSFNEMALSMGFNSVLRGLIAAFILFFGHSLNIVLGFMAVIVHGVRLNMLEFSGHLGMQWSGRPYQPFRD
ncbi:MAG: hypothetical protein ONB30_03910 [candidate division KSB1 bacterium]|nr:hypothetical protein [candidate division KSB1 bacterium]